MPTATYTPLANITLSTTTTSVVFGSIPNTFRDLVLIVTSTSSNGAEGYAYLYFNNDTGANYNRVEMAGNGSSTISGNIGNLIPITYRGSRTNQIINIMDYSANDKQKMVIYRNNQSDSVVLSGVGRWANNSVISTVSVVSFSLAFAAGSNLALYGIAA